MNSNIAKLYNQLAGHTLEEAVYEFQQVEIKNPRTGDLFFETYGVPNTIEISNVPYERFICYEYLLHLLSNEDKSKFSTIHKGTPYYFLAWTAFEIRNYNKAVFYMDLALGEDIRKKDAHGKSAEDKTREALNDPGGNLWKLIPDGPAVRIIQQLKDSIEKTLNNFKNRTSEELLKSDFVDRFVIEITIKDEKNRSLISALYSYIVEAEDLLETLNIRSQNISSIEPYLMNLFKGGLIFETLLKVMATQKSWVVTQGRGINNPPFTIEGFKRCQSFLTFFGLSSNDLTTSGTDLSSILAGAIDDSMKVSFSTTAQLRNLSGHDLRRDDIFQNPDDYKKLVDKELNAIYFVIKKGFI